MYKLVKDNLEVVLKQNNGFWDSVIPMNPDNTDYQTYLKWVEEGGVPLPADE